jgi:hypothetical protein
LLSGLPSGFLLAVTNYITLEVGSFPFVWIMPLALYLGSFIVTFRTNGGVPGFLRLFWLEVLLAAIGLYALGPAHWLLLLGHLCVFFMVCVVSHGLLYERRPEPSRLTHFYLSSAFGGWLGGALVAVVVPFVLPGLYEYPILSVLCGAVFWWHRDRAFTAFWPKASRLAACARMLTIGLLVFPIGLGVNQYLTSSTQFRHRNFYGTYRVVDELANETSAAIRRLMHGSTLHGAQLLYPAIRVKPISYYYEGGPISDVCQIVPSPRRTAVVGLGSEAMSAYMNHLDTLVYYEIDPDNEKIARSWFTYIDESKGKIEVVVGDGRLSIKYHDCDSIKYDLIIIDAFTGDGIPTHLLTREALQIYLDHLSDNGLLLLHISNRYYDLRPVVKSTALTLGMAGVINKSAEESILKPYERSSWCAVLAPKKERLQPLIATGWIPFGDGARLSEVVAWTDDYINILPPLFIFLKARFHTVIRC